MRSLRLIRLATFLVLLTSLIMPNALPPSTAHASTDAAALDSQSQYPTIDPGQSVDIWIRVRNSGDTTWLGNCGAGYGLDWRDGWSSGGRACLSGNVSPGGVTQFGGTVTPPTQPGTYRYGFILRRYNNFFGPYFYIDVTVRRTDPPPPPPPQTRSISFGQTVTGSISPGGQDRWTFSGNQGQSVRIEMSGFDTYLYLNNPGGSRIDQDDDSLGNAGSLITHTLPASGAYTIIAAGYGGSGGSYRLSLSGGSPPPPPPPPPTRSISFGQTVTGSISPGGQDRWTFSGNQGQSVRIEMSGFDTYLYLNDPGGSRMAQDDDSLGSGGSLITGTLPTSGTYTIIAAGYGSSSGNYRLSLSGGSSGTGLQKCQEAAFRFPLRDAVVGWLYRDPRSTDRTTEGDRTVHTGLDFWPPQIEAVPVFPLAHGFVKEITYANPNGAFEIYYDETGITSYMSHVNSQYEGGRPLREGDEVFPDRPIGTLFPQDLFTDTGALILQGGNTHLHLSIGKETGPGPVPPGTGRGIHYNDTHWRETSDPSDSFRANLSYPAGARNPMDSSSFPWYSRLATSFCR